MKTDIALLVIDVQNDFCEDGVLPALNTGTLIGPLNRLIFRAAEGLFPCIFTRDWHPPNHCSFNIRGGPWPPHCIQGSFGARFTEGLYVPEHSLFTDIEWNPEQRNISYSAFENSVLCEDLVQLNIRHLIVTGIATEYCVKETVTDALKYGFEVTVISDLVRPINVKPNDDVKAMDEMRKAGAGFADSAEWIRSFNVTGNG